MTKQSKICTCSSRLQPEAWWERIQVLQFFHCGIWESWTALRRMFSCNMSPLCLADHSLNHHNIKGVATVQDHAKLKLRKRRLSIIEIAAWQTSAATVQCSAVAPRMKASVAESHWCLLEALPSSPWWCCPEPLLQGNSNFILIGNYAIYSALQLAYMVTAQRLPASALACGFLLMGKGVKLF